MKKILSLLLLSTILFTACEGDQGPIGPQGEPGGLFLAKTFEVDNINFSSTNGLDATINIPVPNSIDVFEADVPLVYLLDPIASADNGADVWEPLPRTFFFSGNGFAQYRFNFIFDDNTGIFDLDITLESDDFTALDNGFTQNQVFRIVIVPSEFAENTNINLLDFNAVQSELKLEF